MAADLLDHPQRDAGVRHLGQCGAAEAVGAGSLDADSLAGFSEDDGGRVAGNVPPVVVRVAAGEQVDFAGAWLPERQERSQVFNDRNGAGCQFAFGCSFPDIYRGSNFTRRGVNIL